MIILLGWKNFMSDTNIITEINDAEYVVLNIGGIWNIHINKKEKEIFQENHYHINCFDQCKTIISNEYESIGSLFYTILQSCLTCTVYNRWKRYMEGVLLNQRTAYKI